MTWKFAFQRVTRTVSPSRSDHCHSFSEVAAPKSRFQKLDKLATRIRPWHSSWMRYLCWLWPLFPIAAPRSSCQGYVFLIWRELAFASNDGIGERGSIVRFPMARMNSPKRRLSDADVDADVVVASPLVSRYPVSCYTYKIMARCKFAQYRVADSQARQPDLLEYQVGWETSSFDVTAHPMRSNLFGQVSWVRFRP